MTLYLIVLMGITSQLGYNGSRVAVSLYALELGASQFTVGLLISLYSLLPMVFAIAVAKFVGRVGSRVPVALGIAGMGLSLLLPPLFPGIPVLYVAATGLGLAHLLFMIPVEAGIGGIGGPDRRASNYALLAMGWSLANFLGPVIAGFSIDEVGHVRAFWVLGGLYLLPMLIFWLNPGLLKQGTAHEGRHGGGSVLELWRMPSLRTVLIISTVINSAQNLFQFYFPIYGHELGLSASAIGVILGLVAAAAFVIRGVVPFLNKRWTEDQILTVAVFVAAFSFLLLPFVANPYALAAIAFLLGLGVGSANPLSMSLLYLLTPKGRVAESVALMRTAGNFVHVAVPVFFGSLGAVFGFAAVFLSNSAMLGAGGLIMRRIRLQGSVPPAR